MVFTLCKSKKIYQSHPTEKTVQALNSKSTCQVMATLRLWCQGDDEYFRLYTVRERREIASLLFVCAGVTCSMNM